MRGPGVIIAIVALGGGLFYMSQQAGESVTRRDAMQQASTSPTSADAPQRASTSVQTEDMYDVSAEEGGIRGAMARAVIDGYETPAVPRDPEEIAAAAKAMQADARRMVKARTGLDIATLDPIKRMAAAAKAETKEAPPAEPSAASSTAPASHIVTAEEVLKQNRRERGADEAAGAFAKVLNQAVDDPRLDGEIEKLLGQLNDPEKGRRIVAKARAKGAPEFAILLGLKRRIDEEAEAEEAAGDGADETSLAAPSERKLPNSSRQFKSAAKSGRFKSADSTARFKTVGN